MNVEPLRTMGLAEAKAHLSALIAAVEGGESICLTRRGKPVATVSRVCSPTASGRSPAVPLDLAWLERLAGAMPLGTADDDTLARDLDRYDLDRYVLD